ncbi:MAG: YhcH/YjgK/YiaL family protein [Clostridia bacterium]|nr:YhcH/YjgK/YiaL family protein [Clostridia bacterium]
MIFSSIYAGDDLKNYPAAIEKAIRYAAENDFSGMADGRYEIDGDRMFAQLFTLTGSPIEQTRPELHKKYLDVQFWLGGEEICGVAPANGVGECTEAILERDLYFYDKVENESFIRVTKGCYAVFFPSDAHRPGVQARENQEPYRKVVVKVSLDIL